MTKRLLSAVLTAAALFAAQAVCAATPAASQPFAEKDTSKSVNGVVTGSDDAPLPGAVVYIKNMKTLAIKSYISEDSGAYRFHALSPNVDYQLYAEFNGQRSAVKTVSSFDTKTDLTFNLKVNAHK